jgi:hypothetical protein
MISSPFVLRDLQGQRTGIRRVLNARGIFWQDILAYVLSSPAKKRAIQ